MAEQNNTIQSQTSSPPEQLAATTPKTELEEMTEKELLQKVLEYKTMAQRAVADYRNLQRETERKVTDIQKFATEGLILQLCPLVDYFNQAFAAIPETEQQSNWVQGVKHIQAHLLKILQANHIEIISAIGQPFDPHLHEAIGEEESDQPANTVVKIVQAGFKLNDKVIRHARVMVAKDHDTINNTEMQNQNQASLSNH